MSVRETMCLEVRLWNLAYAGFAPNAEAVQPLTVGEHAGELWKAAASVAFRRNPSRAAP
ncbi:MAG TPA: hypothetical protein VGI23_24135 [Steroidobacteraceae bacterium]